MVINAVGPRVPLSVLLILLCVGGIVVAVELITDTGQVLIVLYVIQFVIGILVGSATLATGLFQKSDNCDIVNNTGLSGIDRICGDEGIIALDLQSPSSSGSGTASSIPNTLTRALSDDSISTTQELETPTSNPLESGEGTFGSHNNATGSTSSSFMAAQSSSTPDDVLRTPTGSPRDTPRDPHNPLLAMRGTTPSRMWVRRSTMTWDSNSCLLSAQSGGNTPTPESPITGACDTPQAMTRTSITKGVVASTYRAKRLGSLAAVLKCAAEENAMANLQVSGTLSTASNLDTKSIIDQQLSNPTVKEPEDLEKLLQHCDYDPPVMPTFGLFGLSFTDPVVEQAFIESYISPDTFLWLYVAAFWVGLILAITVGVIDTHDTSMRLSYYFAPLPSVVTGAFLSMRITSISVQHAVQFSIICVFLLSNVFYESHMAIDHYNSNVQGPVIYSCIFIACITVIAQPIFLWGALSVVMTVIHVTVIVIIYHMEMEHTQWGKSDTISLLMSVFMCASMCMGFLYKHESNKRWAHASCQLLFDTVKQCREEQQRTMNLIQNCLPKRLTDTILTTSSPEDFRSVWFDVCSQCHYGIVVTTDLANFTSICSELSASQVISMLNKLYTNCDYYAQKYSVEKVKTLGDAWIAAVHPTRSSEDYCNAAAMALQISHISRRLDSALSMRVGIGHGILLATMAGRVRTQYEVIGAALTEAVQMESTGIPGMVQVSEGVAYRLRGSFSFEKIEGKNRGSGLFILRKLHSSRARRVSTLKVATASLMKSLPAPETSTPHRPTILQRVLRDPPRGEIGPGPFKRKLGGAMMTVSRNTFIKFDGPLRDRLFQGHRSELLLDGFSFQSDVNEKQYRQFVRSPLTSALVPFAVLGLLGAGLGGGVLLNEDVDSLPFSLTLLAIAPLTGISLLGKGADEQIRSLTYFIAVMSVIVPLGVICAVFAELSLPAGYAAVIFIQMLLLTAFHPILSLHTKIIVLVLSCVASIITLSVRGGTNAGNDLSTLIASIIAGGLLAAYESVITDRTLRRTWEDHQRISQEQQAIDSSTSTAENTLLNAIPAEVLHAVGRGDTEVVHDVEMATVGFLVFDDIIEVTETSSPSDVVHDLNSFLGIIDDLLQSYPQIIKLKNIPYIVVAGCPNPSPDHASSVVGFAHEAMKVVQRYNKDNNKSITAKGGIQCGKLSAGLLGTTNFVYDIFGDCVNTASRMSTNAPPFEVLVSANVTEIVKDEHSFKIYKTINLKGKGDTVCYVRDQSEEELLGTMNEESLL
eukprot:TRINITY_DN5461_c3_g1_i2.p1 TRINITY_DN5461_c3_g1~~TRINITY_DN5461_c3_g1_i2.p1  ORF type:complete len:1266 (+),score=224.90 TRINITY_DN5461_c3_g1_i2:398-4195(+)